MSTRRVKKFQRVLKVLSSVYGSGTTTFTLEGTHYLTSGDLVTILFKNGPCVLTNVAVTVTAADAFSIPTPQDYRIQEDGEVKIDFYATGQTGGQQALTLSNTTGAPAVVQTYVKGTGGASYTIEGSLDGLHWTADSTGTITHTTVTENTQAAFIAPAWAWIRINPSVIGAATKLYANISS